MSKILFVLVLILIGLCSGIGIFASAGLEVVPIPEEEINISVVPLPTAPTIPEMSVYPEEFEADIYQGTQTTFGIVVEETSGFAPLRNVRLEVVSIAVLPGIDQYPLHPGWIEIDFDRNNFDVPGGDKTSVNCRIKVPEDAGPGTYLGYIDIRAENGGYESIAVTVNVLGDIVTVTPTLSPELTPTPAPTPGPVTPVPVPPEEGVVSTVKPLKVIYYVDVDKAAKELVIDITLENIGTETIEDVYLEMAPPTVLEITSVSGAEQEPEGLYAGDLRPGDTKTITQRYKLAGKVEEDLRIPVTIKAAGSELQVILIIVIIVSQVLLSLLDYGIIPGFEAIFAIAAMITIFALRKIKQP